MFSMAKVTFIGTQARVGKGGVWDHRHGAFGWHWASAGHRDNGEIHAAAGALNPDFTGGATASTVATSSFGKATYAQAVGRSVVAKIPSRAKSPNVAAQAAAAAK